MPPRSHIGMCDLRIELLRDEREVVQLAARGSRNAEVAGSSPAFPTMIQCRLAGRTPGSELGKVGSNPAVGANASMAQQQSGAPPARRSLVQLPLLALIRPRGAMDA